MMITGRCRLRSPGTSTRDSAAHCARALRRKESDDRDLATVANRNHAAWTGKTGDFSDVPLADSPQFTGPDASFDSAAGYRPMTAHARPAVTSFNARHQFVDGNRVCCIID